MLSYANMKWLRGKLAIETYTLQITVHNAIGMEML
jgi:hypothetical protein